MNEKRMFVRPWLGHLVKGVALIVPWVIAAGVFLMFLVSPDSLKGEGYGDLFSALGCILALTPFSLLVIFRITLEMPQVSWWVLAVIFWLGGVEPFVLMYQFAVRWRKPSFWGVYFFYLPMFAFSFGLAWMLMEVMA